MNFRGTPVAFAFSSKECAFGNFDFHSPVYLERLVFTPLSVLKPTYARGFFEDRAPYFFISLWRRVLFLGASPWKYFLGMYGFLRVLGMDGFLLYGDI